MKLPGLNIYEDLSSYLLATFMIVLLRHGDKGVIYIETGQGE